MLLSSPRRLLNGRAELGTRERGFSRLGDLCCESGQSAQAVGGPWSVELTQGREFCRVPAGPWPWPWHQVLCGIRIRALDKPVQPIRRHRGGIAAGSAGRQRLHQMERVWSSSPTTPSVPPLRCAMKSCAAAPISPRSDNREM